MNPSASSREISRRAILAGILGGGSVLLTACGDTKPTAAGQPAAASPIRVTDDRGRTIAFDRPVTSVVTIPMPAASLLVAVDQGASHLAAMHSASWTAMKDGIMGDMIPDALAIEHDIATNDFTPNVESILALRPDVVVQWSDSQRTAPLENAGLTVIGLTNHGTQEDVDSWISIFAAMLGKPERSEAMRARSDQDLARITATASGRPAAGPSILYFNRFAGDLKVAAAGTYNDYYIKLVGGTNPATGDTGVAGAGMVGVDVEQVLAWDPEVILLGNFDAAVPDDVYANPVWRHVSAVRSRRVYKVPLGGYRWDPPGQESPLMWEWLSDIAFPRPLGSDLRDNVSSAYSFLYAHNATSAEIDQILWMSLNDGSAHYQQFHAR